MEDVPRRKLFCKGDVNICVIETRWCLFFVSHQDTRLSLIATDQSYRQNFTAADDSRSTKLGTIRSIIDMIVWVLPPLPSFLVLSSSSSTAFNLTCDFSPSFQTNETKDVVRVFNFSLKGHEYNLHVFSAYLGSTSLKDLNLGICSHLGLEWQKI